MLVIVLGVLAAFSMLVWLVVQIRTLTDNSRVATGDDVRRAAELFRIARLDPERLGHWSRDLDRPFRLAHPPQPGLSAARFTPLQVRRALKGEEANRIASICMAVAVLLLICGLALAPLVLRALSRLGLSIP